MMKEEETAEMHDLAFLLLVYPLSELHGALDSSNAFLSEMTGSGTACNNNICNKLFTSLPSVIFMECFIHVF
jgi:hypothetical protein